MAREIQGEGRERDTRKKWSGLVYLGPDGIGQIALE